MLGGRLLALVMRVAEQVAEPVGVAIVAAEQRLQRVALQARLVAVLEQLEQAVVRALLGTGLREHHRRRGGQRSCAQQRRQQDQAARLHRDLGNVTSAKCGRGAAARPQRPFDQSAVALYQKKFWITSTTSPL